MNVTSSLGSASASAWSARTAGPPDNAQRAQFMFKKADADGSGGVDATELQTVLDKISEKTGTDLGKASDRFASMDSDGDGSLSSSELDTGVKSLMPEPSSTMEFAQRMGGGGQGGPGGAQGMPPPPPGGGGEGAGDSSTSSTSATSSSASIDPLDTNEDGVVSAQERMAGDMSQVLQAVMKAGDSDGDGSLSSGEVDTLSKKLGDTLSQMFSAAKDSSSSSSSSSSDSSQQSSQSSSDDAVKQLAQMLVRQYAQPPMDWRSQSSLSVAA